MGYNQIRIVNLKKYAAKKKPKIIENSTIPDFIICVEATRFERATSASRMTRDKTLQSL